MLKVSADKARLQEVMQEVTPVLNLVQDLSVVKYHAFTSLMMSLVSWHRQYPEVDVNNLPTKVMKMRELLQAPQTLTKNLGSGHYRNFVWLLVINDRDYVLYLSTRGLSIEGRPTTTGLMVAEDMKKLASVLLG